MIELFQNGPLGFLFRPPGSRKIVKPVYKNPVVAIPIVEEAPLNLMNCLHIGRCEGVNYYINLSQFDDCGFRFLIVGQSGSGKSYFTRVMLEEFIEKGRRTIVIDPEGEWWSLKDEYFEKDAPGKKVARVKVIGGEHGVSFGFDPDDDGFNFGDEEIKQVKDVCIKHIENLLNTKGRSLVFDLSDFDDEEQQAIYAIITGVLFRMEKKYKKSVFLMVDEASIFAPQSEAANAKKQKNGKNLNCRKASKRNARRGRKNGIRQGYAVQRPANFDKDVLANCTIRFIGRMEDENDYDAVEHLLKPKVSGITFEHMKALKPGQFFLCHNGKVSLVYVRKCHTKHIGSTPEDDY